MATGQRVVKKSPRGAGSFCLVCLGVVIIIPGAAITGVSFSNQSFSEGLSDTMKIAGLVLLGVGIVLISLGCCLCCRLCNNTPTQARNPSNQIVRTPRSNQGVQHHLTPDSQVAMGYAPAAGAGRPSGGYVPMTPQSSVTTQASMAYNPAHPAPFPATPQGQLIPQQGPPQYPPGQYPGQYAPPPGQYPVSPVVPYNPQHAPGQPAYPFPALAPHSQPTFPMAAAQSQATFPQIYSPPELQGASCSIMPSAPPAEDTLSRPPSYEEAMSVQKQ